MDAAIVCGQTVVNWENRPKMTILATVKVSKGFRATIPKEARELLKLEEGDEIVFFTVEPMLGRVCFRKATERVKKLRVVENG